MFNTNLKLINISDIAMSGSESDSDFGLVRVNSVKKDVQYNESARDIEFKIRFKELGKNPSGLIYTLKLGQELPYNPDLSGKKI